MQIDRIDLEFDWYDSTTKFLDSDGKMLEAGTVVRLNNNIIFLKTLSIQQLEQLKTSVLKAVEHELSKR